MDLSPPSTGREAGSTKVNEFNRHLLAHRTATAALAQWCRMHRLGDGVIRTRVLERSVRGVACGSKQRIGYRRVELYSGPHFLSAAEIRYRCGAISREMLAELDATDRPFGAIVAALGPRRITTFAQIPARGMEGRSGGVLVQHATVVDRNGQAIARVREIYQAVLVEAPA